MFQEFVHDIPDNGYVVLSEIKLHVCWETTWGYTTLMFLNHQNKEAPLSGFSINFLIIAKQQK